ncbi:MAG: hypothetical protein K2Y33_10655, partial [Mycolicibacterium frederiksbergense]|nr:hypothetical protein [Mycolicibacterium frederiksbergense]
AAHRVTGESTAAVAQAGSSRPGLPASNRGVRQATATTANVAAIAHAAPISAYGKGTGRSVDPPTP